ncbi:MAG: hypothetical protein IKS40_09400 [Treponema sp.]|nr:hypothetical protein [Treponema sp.]
MAGKISFLDRKFFSLLVPGTLTMIVATLLSLSDSIIAGFTLGKNSVVAVSMVTPAFVLSVSLACFISIGVPILYTRALGEFEKEKADSYFSLGFTVSIFTGLILFLFYFLFGDFYLQSLQPSEEVYIQAKSYFFWYKFTILLYPLDALITEMILADGDEFLSVISNIVTFVGNIIFSIILAHFIGIAGIGMGAFIGTSLSLLTATLHLFRAGNSLKIGIYFSLKKFFTIIKYSAIDAGGYLFLSLFSFAMERFIVTAFGPELLILASIILFVKEFQLVFDGIGEAITPIINIYLGEESWPAIEKCYYLAKKTSFAEGILLTLLAIMLSPLVIKIYAVSNPAIIDYAVNGSRIMALGLVHLSFLYLLTSYYLIIDKILLGFIISGMQNFFVVVPLSVLLGKIFGVYGMFAGIALAPALAYYLSLLYVRLRYGKENCPLMLADRKKSMQEAFFEFTVTPEMIIAVQKQAGDFLRHNGVSQKNVMKSELLIEELFMLIYEKNGKKNTICAECTVIVKDNTVRIITKDDGVLFNIADEDAGISSLRSFVVASFMETLKTQKRYLTTMSYNRNTFTLTEV